MSDRKPSRKPLSRRRERMTAMPRISYFHGIIIFMYWDEGHHVLPHFHVEYGANRASVSTSGALLAGGLPPRCLRLVSEWAELHEDELLANWQLARDGKPLSPIEPLA
jgi:hypothetical protein